MARTNIWVTASGLTLENCPIASTAVESPSGASQLKVASGSTAAVSGCSVQGQLTSDLPINVSSSRCAFRGMSKLQVSIPQRPIHCDGCLIEG